MFSLSYIFNSTFYCILERAHPPPFDPTAIIKKLQTTKNKGRKKKGALKFILNAV